MSTKASLFQPEVLAQQLTSRANPCFPLTPRLALTLEALAAPSCGQAAAAVRPGCLAGHFPGQAALQPLPQ